MSVNAALDRLARPEIVLAGSRQPTFRVCAITGFALAVVVGIALTSAAGLSLAVTALLAVVCAVTFALHTLARTVVTGEERLVYYHHEIACIGACALALWLLGEPVLAYLDIAVVGIGGCLAAGRLGCFAAGCCHGRPCAVGVAYREDHLVGGLASRWVGVRLFPVQLAEAAAVTAIVAAGGIAILAGAEAGTAFVLYVAAYGVVRFALEIARGDHGRGELAGMTEPQWLSLASGLAVVALGAAGVVPAGPLPVALTAVLVVAAVWLAARRAGHRATVPS